MSRQRTPHTRLRACALTAPVLLALVACAVFAAAAFGAPRTERFDNDQGWDELNNRSAIPCVQGLHPTFARRDTSTANPAAPPGELVGSVLRSSVLNGYGRPAGTHTYETAFSLRARIVIEDRPDDPRDYSRGTALVGLLNPPAADGWRTPQAVALRLTSEGDQVVARADAASRNYLSAGDASGRDIADAPRLDVNRPYWFTLAYDPAAAGGAGQLTVRFDDQPTRVLTVVLPTGQRADGATMDTVGVWNSQTHAPQGDESPAALTVVLDEVSLDGAPAQTFSVDAGGWAALGATNTTFADCVVRPRQDFGWSPTGYASGGSGEMGGTIFRVQGDDRTPRAYYGAPLTQTVDLTQRLEAEGDLIVRRVVSDSGLHFGYFSAAGSAQAPNEQGIAPNTLAMSFTGVSRAGYFVVPAVRARTVSASTKDWTLPANPHVGSGHFKLRYTPGPSGGDGELAVTLAGRTLSIAVPLAAKREGASFDHFGFFTFQPDGNSQDVYVDNLSFTAIPPPCPDPCPRAHRPVTTGPPAGGATRPPAPACPRAPAVARARYRDPVKIAATGEPGANVTLSRHGRSPRAGRFDVAGRARFTLTADVPRRLLVRSGTCPPARVDVRVAPAARVRIGAHRRLTVTVRPAVAGRAARVTLERDSGRHWQRATRLARRGAGTFTGTVPAGKRRRLRIRVTPRVAGGWLERVFPVARPRRRV